jgi:hypothetical protein
MSFDTDSTDGVGLLRAVRRAMFLAPATDSDHWTPLGVAMFLAPATARITARRQACDVSSASDGPGLLRAVRRAMFIAPATDPDYCTPLGVRCFTSDRDCVKTHSHSPHALAWGQLGF